MGPTTGSALGQRPFAMPAELRILDPSTGTSVLVGPTGAGRPISGLAFEHGSIDYFVGDRLAIVAGSLVAATAAFTVLHFSLPKAKDDS